MSTPVCVSCQENLSCSDSPLSVTANIIGILTFAGALMISAQVYFNSMRNAERNITEMVSTLQSKYADFQRLDLKLQTEMQRSHLRAKFLQREEMIKSAMAKTETGMATLREIANDVFSSVAPEPTEHEVLFRSEVIRTLAELRFLNRISRLPASRNGGLPEYGEIHNQTRISNPMPEPAEHEVAFRVEVLQDLIEVRNEMRSLKDNNARVLREMQDMLRGALSSQFRPSKNQFDLPRRKLRLSFVRIKMGVMQSSGSSLVNN
ncbi:hypothetical protein BKA61DRAFT_670957 [Leptodontidium sp. MPI-SDFR-AT-0119]|nr:hypothetical protein BKA61DRAFT_670957 [Leptodontidium sp. MPI-SDFR-AT-0119]